MEQTHKDYLAKVESRIAGAKISQLAMAAPLESVNSSSKPKIATPSNLKTPEAKEKSNQKVGIVSALLSIGAIRPALSLITTYPWMVDANPQLADLIIRIMKHSIAVLPFSGHALSDGLTTRLIARLAACGAMRVFRCKNQAEAVELILEGNVRRAGERFRCDSQLVSSSDGLHLWAGSFDCGDRDAFAVEDEFAGQIARGVCEAFLEEASLQ